MKNYFNLKNKIYAALAITALLVVSCTDDLDTAPTDDDTTSAEQFLDSPEAYKQLLAGIYANFALPGQTNAVTSSISGIDAGSGVFTRALWYMQELSADAAIWSYENDPGVAGIQRNTWTDSNSFVLGMWSRMAQSIAFANDFLRQTEGVTSAEVPEIASFRAEARFLRSLAYYYFIDLYGKAPFVDENSAVDPTFQPPQAERQQLFEFIEAEVESFMSDLPDAGQNEYGRADKGAAMMMLAKLYLNADVYLGTPRYDDCLDICNQIIATGAYSLNPVYANNFTGDNHLSNELIFTFISDATSSQSYGGMTIILNGEVGSLENNANVIGVGGFGGALRMKAQHSEIINTAASGDRNTVISANRPANVIDIADRATGYVVEKFTNNTSTGEPSASNLFADTDFPLFRFADVYLMYAEAVERGVTNPNASKTQATDYINELRTRANAPQITINDLNLDFILDERVRELFWEGHRRQDLIRFNRYTGGTFNWDWKGNARTGTAISNNLKVYPIPAQSIGTNPNLKQNEGY